jgi:hypothetical protein
LSFKKYVLKCIHDRKKEKNEVRGRVGGIKRVKELRNKKECN